MLLGIVSDTHGHVDYARQAVRVLESFDIETVLHCGDVGSAAIVPLFGRWPTHFVFGNVDVGLLADEIRSSIAAAGQTCHGRFGSLELGGVKIALLHGDDEKLLARTIADGRHDVLCHGHTHVPRVEKIGGTLVLNPGALFRATPHTLAMVELPSLKAEIISV
jgi:uncharacterized protein